MALQEQIEKVLDGIRNPEGGGGLVECNNIRGLHVDQEGKVQIVMEFLPTEVELGMKLRDEVVAKVKELPGVTDVQVVLTADRKLAKKKTPKPRSHIQGVKHIVLVASGKGGVGKSTTAVNLACGLSQNGLTVGLIDADIYGPSLPRMMGVNKRPQSKDGKRIEPVKHRCIQCMSIGFMMADNLPTVWRGPMVQTAIQQMMHQTLWKDVDVLVVDMPPGTGDVAISLTQNFWIDGAVIVSTPQDISLIDARKAVSMFQRMETPILGVVENMSYFKCPHCDGRSEIFHHGGAREEAEELGVPLLGEIPLHVSIRRGGDEGMPVASQETEIAALYKDMGQQVWRLLNEAKKAA